MAEFLWFRLAIFLGVTALFFLAIVAAGLWEKRPVQPYYVPAVGAEYPPSPTAEQANNEACDLGYRRAGLCHDGKSKLYRVRYDFWISADAATIAVVGSGTVATIAVSGVWLWSRLADGRILCTTNEVGEQNISWAEEQQTWPGLGLTALVAQHERRLSEAVVEPFPAADPLAGYFDIRRRKADALVAKGYAYYLDDERSVWRYTFRGAVVFYFVGSWTRRARRLLRSIGLVRE